jgi:activating signal cointegrator 1
LILKAITLWQPWATLIALGYKKYETRHWATNYRGELAIHAAKRPVIQDELAKIAFDSIGHLEYSLLQNLEYPYGSIIAICDLQDCLAMIDVHIPGRLSTIEISSVSTLEKSVGLWRAGRYAWELNNIKATEPQQYRGSQGLWNLDESLVLKVSE